MGDRISVSFKDGKDESPALFSHWGGRGFLQIALDYMKELIKETSGKQCMPLDRREPGTVMVDFIRHLTKDEKRITNNLYLGKDYNDGDNSDNGHWAIDTATGRIIT